MIVFKRGTLDLEGGSLQTSSSLSPDESRRVSEGPQSACALVSQGGLIHRLAALFVQVEAELDRSPGSPERRMRDSECAGTAGANE